MLKIKHTYNSLHTRRCRIIPKPLRGRVYVQDPIDDRWIRLGTIKGMIATTMDRKTFTFGRKYK